MGAHRGGGEGGGYVAGPARFQCNVCNSTTTFIQVIFKDQEIIQHKCSCAVGHALCDHTVSSLYQLQV